MSGTQNEETETVWLYAGGNGEYSVFHDKKRAEEFAAKERAGGDERGVIKELQVTKSEEPPLD